jgi:hypothetical protein
MQVSPPPASPGWLRQPRQTRCPKADAVTLPQRKKTVAEVICVLGEVLGNQEQYRDLIPGQFVQRYEDAGHFCEKLTEAIECLEEAF